MSSYTQSEMEIIVKGKIYCKRFHIMLEDSKILLLPTGNANCRFQIRWIFIQLNAPEPNSVLHMTELKIDCWNLMLRKFVTGKPPQEEIHIESWIDENQISMKNSMITLKHILSCWISCTYSGTVSKFISGAYTDKPKRKLMRTLTKMLLSAFFLSEDKWGPNSR
jgi:hypothetical protein